MKGMICLLHFVAVYFEPALTGCLVHGRQELVAALVLDWWRVSDCVLKDSFEGFPVGNGYGLCC